MQAGLYWSSTDFRVFVTGTLSVSTTGGYEAYATAGLFTQWTPTLSTIVNGIELGIERTYDGTTNTVTGALDIDDLGIHETVTLTGDGNRLEFRAAVNVWRLADMTWQVDFESMGFYVNGSLDTSLGSATITSSYISTTSVPILGIPATLTAGGGSNASPPEDIPLSTTATFSVGGEGTAYGGWSHNGATHPVDASIQSGMTTSCCDAGTIEQPGMLASSTGEVSVTAEGIWSNVATFVRRQEVHQGHIGETPLILDVYSVTQKITSQTAALMALPSLQQGVIKLNGADYSALIGRKGFPLCEHVRSGTCTDDPHDETPTTSTAYVEEQPNQSTFIAHVQEPTHAMEDTFAESMAAPYDWTSAVRRRVGQLVVVIQAGVFLDPGPPLSETPETNYSTFCSKSIGAYFPLCEDFTDQPDMVEIYAHLTSGVARYINTWGTRLGSFWYDFPPNYTDEDTPPDRRWEVQGVRASPDEYWQPLRTQWMGDSFLDAEDETQTRNSIIAAPLCEDRAFTYVGDYISGIPTSLWGISRFLVDTSSPITSFAWSSSVTSDFTGTDCSLSFNSTRIVVSSITVSPCEVSLDLAGFSYRPFMFAHLCDRYKVDWDTTNVTSVAVFLENLEGERLALTSTGSSSWVKAGTMTDSKFAGSWAQDFSQGVTGIDDTGVDVDAAGDSAGRMADEEAAFAFQLHGGRTRYKLVYVITPVSTGSPVNLKYPEIAISEGKEGFTNAVVAHEHGHHSAFLFALGPGVRYGAWAWLETDPFTVLQTTPNLYPPGTSIPGFAPAWGWKSSILDAGCWRNAVLWGQDRATGLRTWIRAKYSLFELTGTVTVDGSVSDNQVYREADEFCISFPLPGGKMGAQALVNSCAEYAPSVVFPREEYNQSDWSVSSDEWSARAYALDQGPRRYISAGKPFTLRPTGGADITATSGIVACDGWAFRDHMAPVDNNEVPTDYELVVGGDLWANMTPWSGNFSILSGEAGAGGISYDVGPGLRHAVAYIEDSTNKIMLGFGAHFDPSIITFGDTGLTADLVQVRYLRAGDSVLYLHVVDGGSIKRYTTRNEGEGGFSFTGPVTIGSGTQVVALLGQDNREYVYYVDSGTIKGKILDAQGNTVVSTFTAVASGVDDSQIGGQCWFSSEGQFREVLWYSSSGTPTCVRSIDGVTFA